MHELIDERLRASLLADPKVAGRMPALEADVGSGHIAPQVAADEVAELAGLDARAPRRDATDRPS
jgi:LAO/AO transport system kinase